MQNKTATMAKLHELLEEERGLLLHGKLSALPELLERKQTLIDQLGDPAETDLSELHSKLTRNHALLSSAMDGIRRVSDRLDSLRKIRLSLDTYDQQGHRQSLDTHAANRMEKRA